MTEPRKILVGGDEVLWGEDDVLDFLSQYGFAEKMTEEEYEKCDRSSSVDAVYLSVRGRRHCRHEGQPYVGVFPKNSLWQAEFYPHAHSFDTTKGDLTRVVALYLEAVRREQERVG